MRKLSESAAGLSELEKLGGLLPIQYKRTPSSAVPQEVNKPTLKKKVKFFLWGTKKANIIININQQQVFNSVNYEQKELKNVGYNFFIYLFLFLMETSTTDLSLLTFR